MNILRQVARYVMEADDAPHGAIVLPIAFYVWHPMIAIDEHRIIGAKLSG